MQPSSTSTERQPIAVDEHACATAISVSVHFLRKDRRGARRIPFYRLGTRVVYDLTRVREALAATEEGGVQRARRAERVIREAGVKQIGPAR